MLSVQRLIQVLQFDLTELELVVLGILLADSCITKLEAVDFEQTATVTDVDKVSQID